MLETTQYIILGLVQGITEWLPISSDGHLVIFTELFGMKQDLAYEVFLHLASFLVMVYYFRHDILSLIKSIFIRGEEREVTYVYKLLLTTLVTIIVALILEPYIDYFQNIRGVTWFLLLTTIVVAASKYSKSNREIGWSLAIILGIAQGAAVMPGLSRSGLMIGIALLSGVKVREAFRYAFLAAIPAIGGAYILKMNEITLSTNYLFGFLATLIVSLFVLRILEIIVIRNKFYLFSIYTFLLALTLLII